MARPEIDSIIQKCNDLLSDLEQVHGTEIPSTLKEAVDQKWELLAALLETEVLLDYPREQRDADSRRVISVRRALFVIAQLEEGMVAKFVKDPSQLLGKNAARGYAAANFIYNNWDGIWARLTSIFNRVEGIWSLINAIFSFLFRAGEETLKLIVEAVVAVATAVLSAGSLEVVKTSAIEAFKSSGDAAKEMRKKAFPQRTGKRYRRRKVARL